MNSYATKLLPLLVLVSGACAREVPVVEVNGECTTVYTGQLCTWARMKGDSLLDAGAVVPMASIDSAPVTSEMAWPPVAAARLKLPDASIGKSGLTQLTMFWETMGHPPAHFATPHFDFHFYLVPAGEEMGYDCKDLSKPAALPAGYSLPDQPLPPDLARMVGTDTLVGICVPTMGMHSLLTSGLQSEEVLRGEMVIGYYAGKPIFIEPMVTRTMLQEKKSFELPIPEIPGAPGNYPRSFRADYDQQTQSYRFAFSAFAPGS